MPPTGFRLYLDANYDAAPWPFATSWNEAITDLPAALPGGVSDFEIFLPDDCDNGAHREIERQHSTVRTEMAVYRDGDAIVTILRMTDPLPQPGRFAPPFEDSALLFAMPDIQNDELLYVGVNRNGNWIVSRWGQIHADKSGDMQTTTTLCQGDSTDVSAKLGGSCAIHDFEGGWTAALRFDMAAVPGAGEVTKSLRFSACRIAGDTGETIGWTVAPRWCPMLSQLGTLHVAPRPQPGLRLHRADLIYDEEAEAGELELTLAEPSGQPVPVLITVNTIQTPVEVVDSYRHRIVPENGVNAITVKVGNQRSIAFSLEKWSGHKLFPRYPSSLPLPQLKELHEAFEAAHHRQERSYCGEGTWTSTIATEAETRPALSGTESLDHHCSFPAIAYAWASLALDRNGVYADRLREACERILRCERPGGLFRPQPVAAGQNPWDGGAFTQGSVGEVLLLAYRVFGDERYLAAAQRGAAAYDGYCMEFNTNYISFVLWHLSELFEITGDRHNLDRAVWYTRGAIIRGLNPSGAHPGHNYYTYYGDITLKGLSKLLRILPEGHEFGWVLRERTIRYANQILSRQRAAGLFEGRNRLYRGYQHPLGGMFELARTFPEFAPVMEPALVHMLRPEPVTIGFAHPLGLSELALAARYVVEKESGQPVS